MPEPQALTPDFLDERHKNLQIAYTRAKQQAEIFRLKAEEIRGAIGELDHIQQQLQPPPEPPIPPADS